MEENGRLVQFIFRDKEAVMEESEAGTVRYIRTHELLASDAEHARTYYHYASDEMGSITHVTGGEEVLNRYSYDAWGNIAEKEEAVENLFCFAGEQYDPISQQYYPRARFYNPVIGRFTQEDTYRGDGLNLYAYCQNNPVYYVDPSGHFCIPMAEKILAAISEGTVAGQDLEKLKKYLTEKKKLDAGDKLVAEKLGVGSGTGTESKFLEVFATADDYSLSENTFNNHILDRHEPESAYKSKSHFNIDFDIKEGIDSTLRGDTFMVSPNTSGRERYIFEQTFVDSIGTNSKGKPLHTLKVVIDEEGNIITAFPKR